MDHRIFIFEFVNFISQHLWCIIQQYTRIHIPFRIPLILLYRDKYNEKTILRTKQMNSIHYRNWQTVDLFSFLLYLLLICFILLFSYIYTNITNKMYIDIYTFKINNIYNNNYMWHMRRTNITIIKIS